MIHILFIAFRFDFQRESVCVGESVGEFKRLVVIVLRQSVSVYGIDLISVASVAHSIFKNTHTIFTQHPHPRRTPFFLAVFQLSLPSHTSI